MTKLLTNWSLSNLVKQYAAMFKKFFIDLLAPAQYNLWLFICCKTKLEKNFFLKKHVFFTKYTLFAEKNKFYVEKKFILIFFLFTEKAFFTKNEKNIYLIWEIFLSRKSIFILQKKNFLIIKNVFVKTSWWTQ